MLESSEGSSPASPLPGSSGREGFLTRAVGRRGAAMLQRIGRLQPSADERRLWLVEGIVVLATVFLVGALMLLILR